MHVTFSKPRFKGPLADAELHFTDGPLAGCKLEGFGIRQGEKGLFATVPSRPYTDPTGAKKYWDLLRFEGEGDEKYAFRNWLVAQYKQHAGGGSAQATGSRFEAPLRRG